MPIIIWLEIKKFLFFKKLKENNKINQTDKKSI